MSHQLVDKTTTRKRVARLEELVANSNGLEVVGNPQTLISGMQYDSRLVAPGDLFVAIRGGHDDGHNYIGDALARGATAVLVDRPPGFDIAAIVADNTRARLPVIASRFFGRPSESVGVIGITGTDGKTTTSYLLDGILRDARLVTGMIGTVSVRIADGTVDHETRQTTPESLEIQRYLRQMADQSVEWAILEATSHGLDLHRLDEVRFLIGAVTNVTHEHLEHHKTIEGYRRAKGILFERVAAANGIAIINIDDPGAREMISYSGSSKVWTYSATDSEADFFADNVTLRVEGARFRLKSSEGSFDVDLPLLGGFNVMNSVCAAAIASAVGLDGRSIVRSLNQAKPIPGRMAKVDLGQPFSVIVDYAHTPESLTKVLELLRSLNGTGRLYCVSGSAGERDTTKRPLQGRVSASLADVSIFTSEDPRFEDPELIIDQIAFGARELGAIEDRDFHCVTDRRKAIELAMELARTGDCILLAGKGHERSMIWGKEKRPWDEAAVASEILRGIGYGART